MLILYIIFNALFFFFFKKKQKKLTSLNIKRSTTPDGEYFAHLQAPFT